MTGTSFHIPTLMTERLRLRAPRLSDLEAYAEFGASERSRTVGGPFSEERAFSKLATLLGHWALRGFGRWIVTDRDADAPLGIVGLTYPLGWPEPEVAWTVFSGAEGKGVAYEAAAAARRYAFETLGFRSLISCVHPTNARSTALARRLGAVQNGEFEHPEYGVLQVWRHPAPEAMA